MGTNREQRPNFQWSKHNIEDLKKEYYEIWLWEFAIKYGVWKKWIYDNLWKLPWYVISKQRAKAQRISAERRRIPKKSDRDIVQEYKDMIENLPSAWNIEYYVWMKPFIKLPLRVWKLN